MQIILLTVTFILAVAGLHMFCDPLDLPHSIVIAAIVVFMTGAVMLLNAVSV